MLPLKRRIVIRPSLPDGVVVQLLSSRDWLATRRAVYRCPPLLLIPLTPRAHRCESGDRMKRRGCFCVPLRGATSGRPHWVRTRI